MCVFCFAILQENKHFFIIGYGFVVYALSFRASEFVVLYFVMKVFILNSMNFFFLVQNTLLHFVCVLLIRCLLLPLLTLL